MGYTHYFPHKEISNDIWQKILRDCNKLYAHLPLFTDTAGGYHSLDELHIVHWDTVGTPYKHLDPAKFRKVHREYLNFNGDGDMGHEDFILNPKGSSGPAFCKTAGKPYDLFVCACLIVYYYHSSETIDLGSDGDMDDWTPALELVARTIGAEYAMKFKLKMGDIL